MTSLCPKGIEGVKINNVLLSVHNTHKKKEGRNTQEEGREEHTRRRKGGTHKKKEGRNTQEEGREEHKKKEGRNTQEEGREEHTRRRKGGTLVVVFMSSQPGRLYQEEEQQPQKE